MKKLSDFANTIINEQRGRPRKNPEVDTKKIDGKPADAHGDSKIKWGLNEPADNSAITDDDIDPNSDENTESLDLLLEKFKGSHPRDFFIVGKAGWGKTQIIQKVAKKYGREIITVYLDKAAKEDLGGIPLPVKDKNGKAIQEMAPPDWVAPIRNNPDKKYLLFFDEMNQADPAIMNALMPIVLEHEIAREKYDNFFVGAAGNFESENDAVNELSGPLKSRFKPLIVWETNTTKAWKQAFKYLHKKWDKKAGKKLVDVIEENAELFDNPRELENNIIDHFYDAYINPENKESSGKPKINVILNWLGGLAKDDMSRHEETQLKQLAENIFNIITSKESDGNNGGRSGRKDINMVSPEMIAAIKEGMKKGYYYDRESGIKYGVSRENINVIVDEEEVNAEMLERIINKLEAEGIEFKYETNKQWQDAGYKDPDADD